jgi:diguanylate cyclase (GGDEF)-like protein
MESALNKPDIPIDEAARLKALRSLNILDTPSEERFDRLTRMAKRIFGVPIALVSLIDEDRQWFKSSVGLNVDETPRDISFCGHAIHGDDVFIITDATKDKRFADNPLVLNEPNIRFYAGCPLKSLNGNKLGTLCIIDRKPRSLNEEDLQTLKDLASMVEGELAALQLATVDELTDITNRRGFMLLAQHSLSLCARQGIPASLVYLDLNELKMVNDKFGHAEGDRALIAIAKQMKNSFRDSDLYARLGGDEFSVLLTNTTKKLAKDVVTKFLQSLEKYNTETVRGYDISVSYGIVEFNHDKHGTVEALLADADSLMYKHKNKKYN